MLSREKMSALKKRNKNRRRTDLQFYYKMKNTPKARNGGEITKIEEYFFEI